MVQESATQQHTASSFGYATEQPLQVYPAPDPAPEPAMPARFHKLAAMRTWVTTDATATEHGEQLDKDQVSQIFRFYVQDMQTEPRPGQRNKNGRNGKAAPKPK